MAWTPNRLLAPFLAALALCSVCSCAGTRIDPRQAAMVSYVTYETLAPVAASATADLVKIRRVRALTPDESRQLNQLSQLSRMLESYREAHNLYVSTLDPSDRWRLVDLLNQVIDLGLSLRLSFHAVRLSQ